MSPEFPLRPYPWQADAWEALTARVRQSRLPHALLFAGQKGVGKRRLAMAFAQYLLCESPRAEGACGTCRSCGLFAAGNHPDFLLPEPEEGKKDLSVDHIRGVVAYQALKPHYAERRVVVLAPAERMTANAANALLKTLEEPTEGTLLLLVTDRPMALLPTIRSRCQTLTLAAPAADGAVTGWLAARTGLGEDALASLLALSGNAPLHALELAEEGEETRLEVWTGLAQAAKGEASPLKLAARWQEMGLDRALGWTHVALCELIRGLATGESVTLGSGEIAARLQALARAVDPKALFRTLDRIQESLRLLRTSVNAQLLAEEFLIHWTALFPRAPRNRRER